MFQFKPKLIIYTILMLFLGGCDNDTVNLVDDSTFEPVKMGVLLPYINNNKDERETLSNAVQLAADHLNDAGYTIELIINNEDPTDQDEKESYRSEVQNLLETENIQILIGANTSAVTLDVAEQVSIPNGIAQIAYASTSPKITNLPDQDLLFRTAPSDILQSIILAREIEKKGYDNVAIFYVNDAYGQGLADEFKKNFNKLSKKTHYIVAIPHKEEVETTDVYVSYLQGAQDKINQNGKKNEDNTPIKPVIFIAISHEKQAEFYLQEIFNHVNFKAFFSDFMFVDATRSLELLKKFEKNLDGKCGTAPAPPDSKSLKSFNESYQKKYDNRKARQLASYSPNIYDAVMVAALAAYSAQAMGEALTSLTIRNHLRKVAGWPGKQVFAGPEGIKQALAYLREGQAINYVGASGDVDFDESGDVVTPIEVWCYENGAIVTKRVEQPCLLCGQK